MLEKYKEVDMRRWKRAMHCQVFRNSLQPQYSVSFNLDITNFLSKIRSKHYSFTFAFVYAAAKCANDIEEFRYRFLNGKVVIFDRINTSFTYLNKDTELFKVINVDMKDTMGEYVREASRIVSSQEEYFTAPMGNDIYQFSSMPWVPFTHISHTDSGKKDNAVPLFDWGKYYEKDGKVILPFSVQVHHSFVDGIHIGKLYESLQNYLNEF